MKFKVLECSSEDIYRDIVRIPQQHRLDAQGSVVPEGSVCKLTIADRTVYAIMRGDIGSSFRSIRIDERLRNILDINEGDEVELKIRTVCLWGQFWWAWSASDPAYRVAARMAMLSVMLGLLGLTLGIFPFLAPK